MTPAERNLAELREMLARCKARAAGRPVPEPKPLPVPVSPEPPPTPWQDREPGGDDT